LIVASPHSFVAADLDLDALCKAKADAGVTLSVCIPARDEEATVGGVVGTIVRELVDRHAFVDEVLVVDDRSSDRTAAVARDAGARVVEADEVLPSLPRATGKGEALWKSLAATTGDLVVWCDADVRGFDARFVIGLAGPMLLDDRIDFVKGWYERNSGRVTELAARPVIALLLPHLAAFAQPLSGEYGGRRSLLERLPFVTGYGVDLALLADVAAEIGLARMAEVDLGVRVHRNRPLEELSPQAVAVLRSALDRAGVELSAFPTMLHRPGLDDVVVDHTERPPLVDVSAYARRTA
jgi:glucosyl-3-phosphoglycerate synthase